jgi:Zn-dependent protease
LVHLGSIGGTSIDVDVSFIFVAALFVADAYQRNHDMKVALLWAPVLLISVLLHELAHAATIAAFRYGSSQVVLSGMGGVTYNRRRARPWHDLVISLAGPISSFLLAFVADRLSDNVAFLRNDPMMKEFVPILIWANVVWGIFNLIPVSPLDGGHATRNFFRMFLRDRTAFIISVWIAMIVGTIVVILGIRGGEFFVALLLGWYVYMNFQQWQYFRTHGYPGD